jgi:hypothetical protein
MSDHNKNAAFWAESVSVWTRFVEADLAKGDYAGVLTDLTIIESSIKWLRDHVEALETESLRNKAA